MDKLRHCDPRRLSEVAAVASRVIHEVVELPQLAQGGDSDPERAYWLELYYSLTTALSAHYMAMCHQCLSTARTDMSPADTVFVASLLVHGKLHGFDQTVRLRETETGLRRLSLQFRDRPAKEVVSDMIDIHGKLVSAVYYGLTRQLTEQQEWVNAVCTPHSHPEAEAASSGMVGAYADLDLFAGDGADEKVMSAVAKAELADVEAERQRWQRSAEERERERQDWVARPFRFLSMATSWFVSVTNEISVLQTADDHTFVSSGIIEPSFDAVGAWLREYANFTSEDTTAHEYVKKNYPLDCLPVGAVATGVREYHGSMKAIDPSRLVVAQRGDHIDGCIKAEVQLEASVIFRVHAHTTGANLIASPSPADKEAMAIQPHRLSVLVDCWRVALVHRELADKVKVPFVGRYLFMPQHLLSCMERGKPQPWRVGDVAGRPRLPLIMRVGGSWVVQRWDGDASVVVEFVELQAALARWATLVDRHHGCRAEDGRSMHQVVGAMLGHMVDD